MRPRPHFLFLLGLALALVAGGAGCRTLRDLAPGRTQLRDSLIVIPAQRLGSRLLVETRAGRDGPYRFLIDTGASISLVSPELAARHGQAPAGNAPAERMRVQGADGRLTTLPRVTLRRLMLGDAEFDDVSALIYDLDSLSLHLGVRIDGILGFPLFRETLLTLDYPGARVVLAPPGDHPARPGVTIEFNNESKTPLIPIQLGDQSLIALVDSGSDAPLTLNPVGLSLAYVESPRPGAVIATLTGERPQTIGRLAQPLRLGDYVLTSPLVDLTDGLSALGGEVLRHFVVTFDQRHGTVTFLRDSTVPIPPSPKRSLGLSFHKTGPYWRVAGVVADSPAGRAGVELGDLCVRIDGERVDQWTHARLLDRIERGGEVMLTFLHGTREEVVPLPVFSLVP